MKLQEYLQTLNLFSEEEINHALDHFIQETIQAGNYLVRAGQYPNSIAFVESGLFRLFYEVEAEEKIMLFFSENQFVADYFAYLTQTPSIRPIQALEDSIVYRIHRRQLDQLFESSKKWERLGRQLAEAAYVTAVHRANRLLHDDFDTRLYTFVQENPSLWQRVPQYMIASYLNMTPETLSRVKKRLMEKGQIKNTIHKKL